MRSTHRTALLASLILASCGPSSTYQNFPGSDLTAVVSDGGDVIVGDGIYTPPDIHIGSDDGGCGLRTCKSAGANCGLIGDGCGAVLNCGNCTGPQTCGGGGMANVCGGIAGCVPRTCAQLGANCGPLGDGCGNLLNCGTCKAPQTCGGGGMNSVCGGAGGNPPGDGGAPADATAPPVHCVPRTCMQAGANCGPIGDGCGNMLDCGTCMAPQTCGGAGMPSVCGGTNACVGRTCMQAGANCGPIGDGCGNMINCGSCMGQDICGGAGKPSVCGGGNGMMGQCVNLCLKQMTCAGGATTTVSGTVVAPTLANPDPLYNALVYIPNAAVQPFPPGIACEQCGAQASGSPLVSAITGPDGKFTLQNVPVGTNIPLVIQIGRWRRQVVIPTVNPCVDNPLPTSLTRLPRNKSEGDIPLMAMVTGDLDALECVLRKIGISDSEFTVPSANGGKGRIQFYLANGSDVRNGGAPDETTLFGDQARLNQYDLVLFACEGNQYDENASDQQRVINYANAGGRVMATHYSYVWLYNDAPFSSTANWNPDQNPPGDPLTATIDQSFPKGKAFATWAHLVGADTGGPGKIKISSPRHDLDGVVAPGQRWIYSSNTIQHYTFNTPVGAAPAQQCGRVLFSDFHVQNASGFFGNGAYNFPDECASGALTAQEKVLEFMLFDLASCITPDNGPPPTCSPVSCTQAMANCGPVADGCGGIMNCGTCTPPQTCGGGGVPSQCGGTACMPRTCMQQNTSCGPAGDGCGALLNCGMCTPPQTCGGGGVPGVCGGGSDMGVVGCMPRSCAQQNLACGPSGDGCGGLLNCGLCTPPQTCGGGGKPGQCGMSSCVPRSCAQAKANCGPIGDGCGNIVNCGTCKLPQTCGGGGVANQCGSVM